VCLQTIPRLFAEDTALYISQSTFSKMEDLANNGLNNIFQWMLSNGLTLHPKKTVALNILHFSESLTQT